MELPIEIDTEVWGEVQYGEMYYPGIYWLETVFDREEFKRGTGGFFAVTKDYRGGILSQKALKYGELFGDILYFDGDHGECIIEYELLQAGRKRSAARKNGMVKKLDRDLRDKAAYGMERYPEYFILVCWRHIRSLWPVLSSAAPCLPHGLILSQEMLSRSFGIKKEKPTVLTNT